MVKRKANVSIDEWLEGGVSIPGTSPTTTITAEEEPTPSNIPAPANIPVLPNTPATEVVTESVPVEPVAIPVANVAIPGEEEANWFWALLEQSGYERW